MKHSNFGIVIKSPLASLFPFRDGARSCFTFSQIISLRSFCSETYCYPYDLTSNVVFSEQTLEKITYAQLQSGVLIRNEAVFEKESWFMLREFARQRDPKDSFYIADKARQIAYHAICINTFVHYNAELCSESENPDAPFKDFLKQVSFVNPYMYLLYHLVLVELLCPPLSDKRTKHMFFNLKRKVWKGYQILNISPTVLHEMIQNTFRVLDGLDVIRKQFAITSVLSALEEQFVRSIVEHSLEAFCYLLREKGSRLLNEYSLYYLSCLKKIYSDISKASSLFPEHIQKNLLHKQSPISEVTMNATLPKNNISTHTLAPTPITTNFSETRKVSEEEHPEWTPIESKPVSKHKKQRNSPPSRSFSTVSKNQKAKQYTVPLQLKSGEIVPLYKLQSVTKTPPILGGKPYHGFYMGKLENRYLPTPTITQFSKEFSDIQKPKRKKRNVNPTEAFLKFPWDYR